MFLKNSKLLGKAVGKHRIIIFKAFTCILNMFPAGPSISSVYRGQKKNMLHGQCVTFIDCVFFL